MVGPLILDGEERIGVYSELREGRSQCCVRDWF